MRVQFGEMFRPVCQPVKNPNQPYETPDFTQWGRSFPDHYHPFDDFTKQVLDRLQQEGIVADFRHGGNSILINGKEQASVDVQKRLALETAQEVRQAVKPEDVAQQNLEWLDRGIAYLKEWVERPIQNTEMKQLFQDCLTELNQVKQQVAEKGVLCLIEPEVVDRIKRNAGMGPSPADLVNTVEEERSHQTWHVMQDKTRNAFTQVPEPLTIKYQFKAFADRTNALDEHGNVLPGAEPGFNDQYEIANWDEILQQVEAQR